MFTMMADILKGFQVNDDTVPMDVIMKVGHEGHFMGEKHTLDHFRSMWQPMVTDGTPYKAWKTAGSKSAVDHARAKAKEILKTHQPAPLEADLKKELEAMVAEAEKNLPH
jgi:trimethylamine--corrinoid protein Co-methyltransferase